MTLPACGQLKRFAVDWQLLKHSIPDAHRHGAVVAASISSVCLGGSARLMNGNVGPNEELFSGATVVKALRRRPDSMYC